MANSSSSPFAEAAAYYRRGRPPYARETIPYICEAFQLTASARALDLGCGPGTLTIPLSQRVREVVAVDQDEAMLAEGRTAASALQCTNITWQCGRAEAFASADNAFDVVTLGQSFHWMDRDRLLRQLAPMIRDGGGIALVAPSHWQRDESWQPIVNAVTARYVGPLARHPKTNPEPENTPSLDRSGTFRDYESRCFVVDFERDVSSVLEYVYSRSDWPRSRFGAAITDFERELRAELLAQNPSGVFRERIATEVVTARKQASTPSPASCPELSSRAGCR